MGGKSLPARAPLKGANMKPFYLEDEEIATILALRQLSAHERHIIEGAIQRTATSHEHEPRAPLPAKVVPLRNP